MKRAWVAPVLLALALVLVMALYVFVDYVTNPYR